MLTLSQSASKELEVYFADKEKANIRVYLAPGGCSGPSLSLALDEAGEDDSVFTESGFSFCINKDLLAQIESVSIDFSDMGFAVEPGQPIPGAGGGCGGCGGGCHSR